MTKHDKRRFADSPPGIESFRRAKTLGQVFSNYARPYVMPWSSSCRSTPVIRGRIAHCSAAAGGSYYCSRGAESGLSLRPNRENGLFCLAVPPAVTEGGASSSCDCRAIVGSRPEPQAGAMAANRRIIAANV